MLSQGIVTTAKSRGHAMEAESNIEDSDSAGDVVEKMRIRLSLAAAPSLSAHDF